MAAVIGSQDEVAAVNGLTISCNLVISNYHGYRHKKKSILTEVIIGH